ncbi:hypothetical protein, partial [Gorillibacterium sp. sgz5001074]|uniref:hypothetical protein n=1 Tax=Gorillibacterium sp. sgz5001074 TaxID=3446695 RepID=UPI003F665262
MNLLVLDQLKNWSKDNDIKTVVINYFWISFNNYIVEEPKEFSEYFIDYQRELIDLKHSRLSITISHWMESSNEYNENSEYIEAVLDVFYKDKYLG